jgi:hypothetical protein
LLQIAFCDNRNARMAKHGKIGKGTQIDTSSAAAPQFDMYSAISANRVDDRFRVITVTLSK